jgi:hypothetical protein
VNSRPLRHRTERWRSRPTRLIVSRDVSDRPAPVRVTVSVTDFATSVTESFSILPGTAVRTTLTGYISTNSGPRVLAVPVEIRAHL